MRSKRRVITLTLIVLLLFLIPRPQRGARAQDGGPECPPGFFWDRLSGVGCVQESCLTVPNAKYSYTASCICLEGYKSCTVPVDHAGLACEPFCPAGELVACVPPDQPCPGEGGTGGEEAGPAEAEGTDLFEDFFTEEVENQSQEQIISDLLTDLEDFLTAGSDSPRGLGRSAGAAASVTALLTAWVITQLLAGADKGNLIQAISRWRGKSKGAGDSQAREARAPAESQSEPDRAKTETVTVEGRPPDAPKAGGAADSEAPPHTKPPTQPDAPPDLPTLRRLRVGEKMDAQERIAFLKRLRTLLDEEYRRLWADWEVARRCAPVDGVIDIADIWLGLRGKLGTSTVRGAYGKDLLKQAIKGAFRKIVRYRVDGTFDLSPGAMLEGAHSGLGVNPYRPGGALKQLLQNLVSGKGALGYGASQKEFFKSYGKGISEIYGTGESVISLVANTRQEMDTCGALREQMNQIRTLFNKTTSDLETAQTDFDVASSAVKAIDQDIQELKTNFPNRFKDL